MFAKARVVVVKVVVVVVVVVAAVVLEVAALVCDWVERAERVSAGKPAELPIAAD